MNDASSKVYPLPLPEYAVTDTANFRAVAGRMDAHLAKHFEGKEVLIRCIDLLDHPGCSREEVIDNILTSGTDIENVKESLGRDNREVELCLFPIDGPVRSGGSYFYSEVLFNGPPSIIWDFHNYEGPNDRRHRIDLALVYDAHKMTNAEYQDSRYPGQLRTDGFNFADKNDKSSALLGILSFT